MDNYKHALICSVVALVSMTTVSLLSGGTTMQELIIYCECAVAISMLGFLFLFPPLLTVCYIAIVLLLPGKRLTLLPLAVVCAITIGAFLKMRRRYSSVRPLFRNDAVWKGLEDISDIISYVLLADDIVLLMVAMSVSNMTAMIISAAFVIILYVFTFIRYLRGRTIMLGINTQEEILTLARGCLRPHEFDPDIDDKRMTALYKRVIDYMEDKKPYLDEEISLEQFSRHVYSNKTYLSKTINVMSGHNFRQFMNYYRVEYSLSLLKENPSMRMEEVAMMSGFHNVVSFNMAFRLFMSETPTEWMRTNNIKN